MGATAIGGLLLQNAALMYFKASEVVPLYFCLFTLGGVAASGLAFNELTMPWLLLLAPGVGFCIAGVFVISYKRDERIFDRLTLATGADGADGGMPPVHDPLRFTPADRRTTGCGHTGCEPATYAGAGGGLERSTTACDGGGLVGRAAQQQQHRTTGGGLSKGGGRADGGMRSTLPSEEEFFGWGRQRGASMPATMADGGVGDGEGSGSGCNGNGGGNSGGGAGSAHGTGGRSGSRTASGVLAEPSGRDLSRMSLMSDGCSVTSAAAVASAAQREENAVLVGGGSSFSSIPASYRMARTASTDQLSDARYSCLPPSATSRGLLRNVAADAAPPRLEPPGRFGCASTHASEALLPREALLPEEGQAPAPVPVPPPPGDMR